MAKPSEDIITAFSAMGQIIAYWNRVEECTRLLIRELYKSNPHKTDILTAHLGTNGLCDALRTLSNEFGRKDIRPHIAHFISYFERVREYRNYYAHSMLGMEGNRVYLQSLSARSQLTLHHERIPPKDLRFAVDHILILTDYGLEVFKYLRSRSARKKKVPPRPLPDKPPLPDKLKKPRERLRDREPQPRSSRP